MELCSDAGENIPEVCLGDGQTTKYDGVQTGQLSLCGDERRQTRRGPPGWALCPPKGSNEV